MKHILKSITILLLFAFVACEGMDEHYKDFQAGGPIVYINKLESIITHSGDQRMKISWDKSKDPRAETVKVYWANQTDSIVFKLAEHESDIIISPLTEASYIFEIFVLDKKGNTSVVDIIPGEVYGDIFQKNLLNRRILSTKKTGNTLKIVFAQFSDSRYQGTEVVYTNTNGDKETAFLKNSYIPDPKDPKKQIQVTEFTIDDYQEDKLEYRAVFLPNKDALDLFYCDTDLFEVN